MSEDMIPVGLNDPMGFNCGADNPCFNDCCRDLSQALTPYDVLRMKQALGIHSRDFLREYTSMHVGPGTGLPVVEFKPNPATQHACPFVTVDGCFLYADRPGSCRLYPLARAIAKDRTTGVVREYYARIEEDHCKGHGNTCEETGDGLTVAQWLSGQDVTEHNRQNDKLMALISLKNQIMPGPLEGYQSTIFYDALYNLDEFRHQIMNEGLLDKIALPDGFMETIKTDEALLDFGIQWVKFQLFGRKIEF